MRSLSSLGFKHLKHRKARSALTGLGIAFGVAIFFATMVSNATTEASLRTIIQDVVGRADVLITTPGFDNFDESDIAESANLPNVALVVPRLGHAANIDSGEDVFTLVGTDIDSDREVSNYYIEPGGRLPDRGHNELVLPRRLANTLDVAVGSTVRITTGDSSSRWQIVGILEDRGAGRAFEGNFMVGWLPAVQRATHSPGAINSAIVLLDADTDAAKWIRSHGGELPENLTAVEPGTAGGGFLQILAATQSAFLAVSLVAVIVAVFLVYNSLSMALAERVQLYGTLRALGANRRQVIQSVVTEALGMGSAATLFGLGLGLALARLLISLMENIFAGNVALDTFSVPSSAIALAASVGIVVTLIAALVPARRASRVDPIVAMANTKAMTSERRLGRGWIVGAVLFGSSIAANFALALPFWLSMVVQMMPLVGAILMVPLVLRPLGSAIGSVIAPLARGVGRVSVGHLTKERTRSSLTLGILMAVLGMIITIGTINRSMSDEILDTVDREFGADFLIMSPDQEKWPPLDRNVERRLRSLPEIGALSPLSFHATTGRNSAGNDVQVFVDGTDPDALFSVRTFDYVQGDDASVLRGIKAGGILVTQRTADALGIGIGDMAELNTKKGRRQFLAVGVYKSANMVNLGYIDERVARRIWGSTEASMIEVNLRPGVGIGAGETAIATALRGIDHKLETNVGLEEQVRQEFNGFFAPFWAILATAVVVGLLGIANTLAMAVLQRFREFGVLRAIGVGKGAVRRMVLVESLTMAAVAFVLAVPLGMFLSSATLGSVAMLTGYETPWLFPANWALYAFVIAALVGMLGALLPGRRAARIEIVEALAYE